VPAAALYVAGTRRKHLLITVRAAMLLYPLYLAEVNSFVYLVEILLQGSVTYITPAIVIAVGVTAAGARASHWTRSATQFQQPHSGKSVARP
jgi:hypothetical protein